MTGSFEAGFVIGVLLSAFVGSMSAGFFMSRSQTVKEKIALGSPVVYPVALIGMMVGNLTGDFAGFYAQTAAGLVFQIAALVLMAIAPALLLCTDFNDEGDTR